MPDSRNCGSEFDAATRIRPFVFGRVFAVFMCAAAAFAAVFVPGNSAALDAPVIAVDKSFAVVGEGVGGPDQWPDDSQKPGYVRKRGLAHFSFDNSQYFSRTMPGFA